MEKLSMYVLESSLCPVTLLNNHRISDLFHSVQDFLVPLVTHMSVFDPTFDF